MPLNEQKSFAGGELSPAHWGRSDMVKFVTGARALRNFFVASEGGAWNRPGTSFVCEVKDSTKAVRLIKFVFNNEQTYTLEFGNLYMRVIRAGARVSVSSVTAWSNATAYVVGDLASDAGVNYYCILGHTNQQPPNATYWYPLTGSIYEIPTPYLEADLPNLKLTQSADVVTIVNRGYAIRELRRTGHTSWVLATKSFTPSILAPAGPAAVNGTAGTTVWRYKVTAVKTDTYEESLPTAAFDCTGGTPTAAAPNTLSWTLSDDAAEYNVYREVNPGNGVYGLIGVASGVAFSDYNATPDQTKTPPVDRAILASTDNYPGTVAYFQQRLTFASTNNETEKVFASRSGKFSNFTVSSPSQEDDAVTFTLAGRQVNEIRHLVEIGGKLVSFTSGGELTIQGDSAGILKPGEINPKQHTYNGSSNLAPIPIDSNALYVQERGSIVRDLFFDFQSDGYRGNDLTIFASHMFKGYTLADWDYQKTPNSIVWAVRDDGIMLGLTYLREHQIWGWHRHDTDGIFENVCCVPEGLEDAVYVVVQRTIDGSSVRYIERMNTRLIGDIEDAIFMDCAATYDGWNTGATNMRLMDGTTWSSDETVTLESSAGYFVSGDVGDRIFLVGSDGTQITFKIVAYVSATEVTGKSLVNIPAVLRSTYTNVWARAKRTITGLDHIEGEAVSILGDGEVIASPNGSNYADYTVSGGQVVLDIARAVVHIGLPYLSDLRTLDIDIVNGNPVVDRKKRITKVAFRVQDSRGGHVGPKPPDDDETDPLQYLDEFKARENEDPADPATLLTGIREIQIMPEWNSNGSVFVRQTEPLPLAILSVAPSGDVATGGG